MAREPLEGVVSAWRTIELFSPQKVPKITGRASRPDDRQVIEWRAGMPLPWETLPAPRPFQKTRRVWRHTMYVGVYALEDTYATLQRVFGEDDEAYDERAGGVSACAGLVVDGDGRVIVEASVLSSALWAVGRAHDPGPGDPSWMEGFEKAAETFVEAVDAFEGNRREKAGEDRPPACDEDAIVGLVSLAHTAAGIASHERLATRKVVIESVAISAQRAEDPMDTDFLNSFYLEDLADVAARIAAGDYGAALATYLTPSARLKADERIDVVQRPDAIEARVRVEQLPQGRWPSNPEHGLALSQQFAVNEALNELAATTGLLGVNGPPGTGKTTMLRDILAGNVVERARRLAALQHPHDAFTEENHVWNAADGYKREVAQLRDDLIGFEMVVASANNAAVENVTAEIPAKKAIDERWHGQADYFADIATRILTAGSVRGGSNEPAESDEEWPVAAERATSAWGLVAAKLGKKRNRSTFRSEFWFDPKSPPQAAAADGTDSPAAPGMQTILAEWAGGTRERKSWAQARRDFHAAEARVDRLLGEQKAAQERLELGPVLAQRLRELPTQMDVQEQLLVRTDRDLADQDVVIGRQDERVRTLREQYERQHRARPGTWEVIFTFGSAIRRWRHRLEPAAVALGAGEQELQQLTERREQTQLARNGTVHRLTLLWDELATARREHDDNRRAREQDKKRIGKAYPDGDWIGDARELHAPWLDPELDTARSELFLAALELHRDFLAAAATRMLKGLRAAVEVVAGIYPRDLEEEKIRAAWQLFFLVVPMVSTTFASASRMFAGVGREAIGWLFIDEAGQASPQYAAGAIWRARRVVAVGDPLQLEPVVTIPVKAQRDIAQHYHVEPLWLPPAASVQTLADRTARFGTSLDHGEQRVWVSSPLRVHRRCDDPMFGLSNRIAYNGLMVNGVPPRTGKNGDPDPFGTDGIDDPIAVSHWVDEAADQPGTHLQPKQIARLEAAIRYLKERGIAESDIIAISPFRAVADRLRSLAKAKYPNMTAGTIHTAQGREAPVVILVLGGDPAKDGAKAWAASKPNLVNVAASRAQRRLYVIGDRGAWAKHNYFNALSTSLDRTRGIVERGV